MTEKTRKLDKALGGGEAPVGPLGGPQQMSLEEAKAKDDATVPYSGVAGKRSAEESGAPSPAASQSPQSSVAPQSPPSRSSGEAQS